MLYYIEHDVEQFEDDPLEFIRIDLSLPLSTSGTASFSSTGGGDGTSRRQAAADVVRALVINGYEAQVTEIVSSWVNLGLQVHILRFCEGNITNYLTGICQESFRKLEVKEFGHLPNQCSCHSWPYFTGRLHLAYSREILI
jgi:hypothetical protein